MPRYGEIWDGGERFAAVLARALRAAPQASRDTRTRFSAVSSSRSRRRGVVTKCAASTRAEIEPAVLIIRRCRYARCVNSQTCARSSFSALLGAAGGKAPWSGTAWLFKASGARKRSLPNADARMSVCATNSKVSKR